MRCPLDTSARGSITGQLPVCQGNSICEGGTATASRVAVSCFFQLTGWVLVFKRHLATSHPPCLRLLTPPLERCYTSSRPSQQNTAQRDTTQQHNVTNTKQHNTTQQHTTAQLNITQHISKQQDAHNRHSTPHHATAQHCTAQHTTLHNITEHLTTQHITKRNEPTHHNIP